MSGPIPASQDCDLDTSSISRSPLRHSNELLPIDGEFARTEAGEANLPRPLVADESTGVQVGVYAECAQSALTRVAKPIERTPNVGVPKGVARREHDVEPDDLISTNEYGATSAAPRSEAYAFCAQLVVIDVGFFLIVSEDQRWRVRECRCPEGPADVIELPCVECARIFIDRLWFEARRFSLEIRPA